MKTSLILCSAAVIAVVLPTTLFAQTTPVAPIVVAPVARVVVAPAVAAPVIKAAAAPVAAAPVVKAVAVKAATVPAKRPAVKPATIKKAVAKKVVAKSSSAGDLKTARAVLASLKAKYGHLDGVTVTIGKTPGGYQAVSYYTKGRIVISPTHRATITRILKHEIWHIIDWRDNGKINWRESVPPKNAASYLN